jgi:hypothetical protein
MGRRVTDSTHIIFPLLVALNGETGGEGEEMKPERISLAT